MDHWNVSIEESLKALVRISLVNCCSLPRKHVVFGTNWILRCGSIRHMWNSWRCVWIPWCYLSRKSRCLGKCSAWHLESWLLREHWNSIEVPCLKQLAFWAKGRKKDLSQWSLDWPVKLVFVFVFLKGSLLQQTETKSKHVFHKSMWSTD